MPIARLFAAVWGPSSRAELGLYAKNGAWFRKLVWSSLGFAYFPVFVSAQPSPDLWRSLWMTPIPPSEQFRQLMPLVQSLSDSLARQRDLRQEIENFLFQVQPTTSPESQEARKLLELLEAGSGARYIVVQCYYGGVLVDQRVCLTEPPQALLPCIILWRGCVGIGGVAIAYEAAKLSGNIPFDSAGSPAAPVVYPNPSAGEVWVRPPGKEEFLCEVYDEKGEKHVSYVLKGEESRIVLPAKRGLYWLRVTQGEKRWLIAVWRTE
ncbi:MAG: T9SS type A sorting domain-containing protein [Bacteroidia bacterium]|nr:T9SS type A sorting domain-containing protein [Bacteroidia bacterium]